MIKTKGKYDFSVDAHYALWCTVWPWFNQIVFKTYVDPNLRISLSLRVKIDMNWFVDYTHMTKKWQVNWCNEIWRCKTATRRFYNIISQLSLCQSKIHRRLVKKISREFFLSVMCLSRPYKRTFQKNALWKTNPNSWRHQIKYQTHLTYIGGEWYLNIRCNPKPPRNKPRLRNKKQEE